MTNSAAVRRLEREAQSRGDPLTLADLAKTYGPIPDDQNAAIPLLELWEAAEPKFCLAFRNGEDHLPRRAPRSYDPALPFLGSQARHPSRTEPLAEQSQIAAGTFLDHDAPSRIAVIRALQRPDCRFPIRMELGAMTLLPHLAELKAQAQIFLVESLLASERGESDAAIDALENVLRVARLIDREPILISQLVRVACVAMALDGAEHVLSRSALSRTQLNRLQEVFEQARLEGALRRAFVGERALALNIFRLSRETLAAATGSDDPEPDDPDTKVRGYRTGMAAFRLIGLEAVDRRLMMQTLNEAVALAEKDTPATWRRLEDLLEGACVKAHEFPPKIFSGMLLPALTKAGDKFAALEARRRSALMAVGIELYGTEHGGLRERLEELTPKYLAGVPVDPFDGMPLRFHRRGRGYVVYSVGPDRTDDGGRERPQKRPPRNYDATFVVDR